MIIYCKTPTQIKRIDTIKSEYHSKEYYGDEDIISYEEWEG